MNFFEINKSPNVIYCSLFGKLLFWKTPDIMMFHNLFGKRIFFKTEEYWGFEI